MNYRRTKGIREDMVSGFCPGCMHGTVFKLIGEVVEELGIRDRAANVQGVGCCGLAMEYVTYDVTTSPHGRACAVATGVKRANPETIVFTYQGDGDLASIGLAESMSAANRGENITVIFINNGIYGMTGGADGSYDPDRNESDDRSPGKNGRRTRLSDAYV